MVFTDSTHLKTVVYFARRWNSWKCDKFFFLRSIWDRNSIFKPCSDVLV